MYLDVLTLAYNFSKVQKYVFHKYNVFQNRNTFFINTIGQRENMLTFASALYKRLSASAFHNTKHGQKWETLYEVKLSRFHLAT